MIIRIIRGRVSMNELCTQHDARTYLHCRRVMGKIAVFEFEYYTHPNARAHAYTYTVPTEHAHNSQTHIVGLCQTPFSSNTYGGGASARRNAATVADEVGHVLNRSNAV